MGNLSSYSLTIIGAIVVLIISAGVVILVGGPQNAAPYLGLLGLAVPVLLGVLRAEANAQQQQQFHQENQKQLQQIVSAHEDSAPPPPRTPAP